eukprot:scaffold3.g6451.t1
MAAIAEEEQDGSQQPQIFSVGHSTRTVAELADLLKERGVRLLVDVRTVPRSRTNPQFNKDELPAELEARHGLAYEWLGKELGGKPAQAQQRDPAAQRGTPAFAAGLARLLALAGQRGPVAIMCAEVVHFSCHRRMIADALAARGVVVQHIGAPGKPATPHHMTEFARRVAAAGNAVCAARQAAVLREGIGGPGQKEWIVVEGHRVTYPPYVHDAKARAPEWKAIASPLPLPQTKKKRKTGAMVKRGPLDAFVKRSKSDSASPPAVAGPPAEASPRNSTSPRKGASPRKSISPRQPGSKLGSQHTSPYNTRSKQASPAGS